MEEPPQKHNKSVKKCSFFMGIFTWLEPVFKKRPLGAFLAKIEASAQ